MFEAAIDRLGTPWLTGSISLLITALGPVGFTVNGDHGLVDAPRRLDREVGVSLEQICQPLQLFVGEQVWAGVQDPARR